MAGTPSAGEGREPGVDAEGEEQDDSSDHSDPPAQSAPGQSVTVPDEPPEDAALTGRRRIGRRTILSGVLALVLAVGVGATLAYQAGSRPFQEEGYCWGAWSENGAPDILGEEALGDGDERTGTATAAPSSERPRGKCSVRLTEEASSDSPGLSIEVRYGTVPKGARERGKWLADFMRASTVPAPDELPGVVAQGSGMVVLPESCDVDGRPSVVTLRGKSVADGVTTDEAHPFATEREVLDLLLAVANKGMTTADCALEHPYEAPSPITGAVEEAFGGYDGSFSACRIPGLRFDTPEVESGTDAYVPHVSVLGKRRQICWLGLGDPRNVPDPEGQYLMVAEPRLVALFDGMTEKQPPAEGWRGSGRLTDAQQVVRADCSGEPTVFYGWLAEGLRGSAHPGPKQVFTRFTDAVAKRIDCAPVTP